jgi:hypothetical protein
MRTGTLRRHRAIGVAALLSLGGIVIAACAPATEDAAAPVYLMGTVAPDMIGKVSPVMRQSVAAAPIEPAVSDPTPLAPSMTAPAAGGKAAVDVIPLDEPSPAPAKPAPRPALMAANPAPMSARFMPPPDMPAAMPRPTPVTNAAAKAETSPVAAPSAPLSVAAPVAPPRPEPSAAELARAEPAPVPASAPIAQPVPAMAEPAVATVPPVSPTPIAEPARGDIATTGVVVSARDERSARYRPRYYYAP